VEKHINSIFAKLGVTGDPGAHRRVAAVLAYLSASGPQHANPAPPGCSHHQPGSCPHDGGAAGAQPR